MEPDPIGFMNSLAPTPALQEDGVDLLLHRPTSGCRKA